MAGFLYSGSIPSPDPIDCRNVPTYALPAAAFVHSSCVRVLSSSGVCVYGLLAVGAAAAAVTFMGIVGTALCVQLRLCCCTSVAVLLLQYCVAADP